MGTTVGRRSSRVRNVLLCGNALHRRLDSHRGRLGVMPRGADRSVPPAASPCAARASADGWRGLSLPSRAAVSPSPPPSAAAAPPEPCLPESGDRDVGVTERSRGTGARRSGLAGLSARPRVTAVCWGCVTPGHQAKCVPNCPPPPLRLGGAAWNLLPTGRSRCPLASSPSSLTEVR